MNDFSQNPDLFEDMPDHNAASPLMLQNVGKSFHQGGADLHVLQGVNLSLQAGEAVALVGPSGSGKSTLLQIAGLLDKADTGTISVAGTALDDASEAMRTRLRRREIGFVYQFHHLLPELTAQENISLPQRLAGLGRVEADERSFEILSMLRLGERASHFPSQLSGGEQQRVAIGRAIANAPSLLIADEPTGNLDVRTGEEVWHILQLLVRQTGLAALIATHNLELAARMDRVITLEDGQIKDITASFSTSNHG
jgi:lipoprotein-releasing system ATP-binding protein